MGLTKPEEQNLCDAGKNPNADATLPAVSWARLAFPNRRPRDTTVCVSRKYMVIDGRRRRALLFIADGYASLNKRVISQP